MPTVQRHWAKIVVRQAFAGSANGEKAVMLPNHHSTPHMSVVDDGT
jgi:hypothetical protein